MVRAGPSQQSSRGVSPFQHVFEGKHTDEEEPIFEEEPISEVKDLLLNVKRSLRKLSLETPYVRVVSSVILAVQDKEGSFQDAGDVRPGEFRLVEAIAYPVIALVWAAQALRLEKEGDCEFDRGPILERLRHVRQESNKCAEEARCKPILDVMDS